MNYKKRMKQLRLLVKFIKQTIKNYKSMKKKMKALCILATVMVAVCSCGSTKVAVDRPAAGTQTTITVTTNNPITTNVEPQTSATLWDKK